MIKKSLFKRFSNNISDFRLRKLYLDCIDDSGNCFIVYWAEIRTRLISVVYSGLIFSDHKGSTIQGSSFIKIPCPAVKDFLSVNYKPLGIKGSWERCSEPLASTLLSYPENREVNWNCHHPKALAEINFRDVTYKGYGYGETLTLTIKPWDLPMNELRWGRFLSDAFSIVWVYWSGSYSINKIFCNGTEFNDLIFEAQGIRFDKEYYTLIFENVQVIRDGRISDSLPATPLLRIISKSKILTSVETKYKAKSTLSANSVSVASGWSLYETVIWEK